MSTLPGPRPAPGEAPQPVAGGRRTLMRSIIGFSLHFRFLVVAAGVAMMVFGVLACPRCGSTSSRSSPRPGW